MQKVHFHSFTKHFIVYIKTLNSYYILPIRQIIPLIFFQLYGVNLKKILAHKSGISYNFAIFGHDAKKSEKRHFLKCHNLFQYYPKFKFYTSK